MIMLLAVIDIKKSNMNNSTIIKLIDTALQVAVAAALLGVSFRVMHWPYATLILVVSSVSFACLYPIKFTLNSQKKTSDYFKLVLALTWGLGTLFSSLELQYSNLMNYLALGIFLLWFLFNGLRKDGGISGILFIISAVFVGLGCLFRFMHWPGISVLFGIGILTGCLWVVIGMFLKSSEEDEEQDEIDEIGKS